MKTLKNSMITFQSCIHWALITAEREGRLGSRPALFARLFYTQDTNRFCLSGDYDLC